jgi:protein ImuA
MRVAPALPPPCYTPAEAGRWATGVASLDAALAGGVAYGRIHEIYAAEAGDASAAAGLAVAMTTGMTQGQRSVMWLRSHRAATQGGFVQASGWGDLGGAPGNGLLGLVPDTMALLRTAVDALRCASLGAVIVEGWGAMRELDLTASRRLALAAERSGVPLFVLRFDATPVPSAAQTRWQVAAMPSHELPGRAPGMPAFDITLLRQRSGPCGLDWRLEWDRDQRKFREAALSGAVVPVPVHRPVADSGAGIPRYAA